MTLTNAIKKRISDICAEKGISICSATLGGGKSPSSIYDLFKGRTKNSPTVATIRSFCEGAGITLAEFFDADYFADVEE